MNESVTSEASGDFPSECQLKNISAIQHENIYLC